MRWLALDIGGANIKAADGAEYAATQPFALWKQPHELAQFLRRLIADSPACDRLAITMTGELADCFETKAIGVRAILNAVNEAADGRHTRVYLSNGKLVTPQVAKRSPQLVAAANWHALAAYATRFSSGPSVLLDIGSTTTDIIPLNEGKPIAKGTTDTQRLAAGELYYSGVQRNPLCGVAHIGAYRGTEVPLAQEYFATSGDVYLILGDLPEVPTNTETADGRPATKKHARSRLSRMVCADVDEFNHRDAVNLAQSIANYQQSQISMRVERVMRTLPGDLQTIITSGVGEFLGQRIASTFFPSVLQTPNAGDSTASHELSPIISLRRELDLATSIAATAHALAVLARETTSA